MNRVIKFRFWTTDKRMIDDHEGWVEDVGINYALSLSKEYGYIAMQFTGLCDRNGTEIYESDYVKHFEGEGFGVVKYLNCSFIVEWIGMDTYSDLLGWYNWKRGIASEPKDWEVIGNIYQHKPTLNQQDQR